jgi:hypothetical protein
MATPAPTPTTDAAQQKIAALEKQKATQLAVIEKARSTVLLLDAQIAGLKPLATAPAK